MRNKSSLLLFVFFLSGCSFKINQVGVRYNSDTTAQFTSANDSSNTTFSTVPFVSQEEQSNSELADESFEDSNESPVEERQLYEIQIENNVNALTELRAESEDNETYCFFTDPHCFSSTRDYNINVDTLEYGFNILEQAYAASSSSFIMCGGDLLNSGDTKSQACYKLSYFSSVMKTRFDNSYMIVGNHDTNYLGDTYVDSQDYNGCILSQNTLNDVLYDGDNSYYRIDTSTTSYYCFDSGIDFLDNILTDYKKEQLSWFASSLLTDEKPHKAIFIHIASAGSNISGTSMMSELDRIIGAFNNRNCVVVEGNSYDYSNSCGSVYFFHAGHNHQDLNGFTPSGVPVFLTRTFGSPEIATQPTFDIVFVDYSNLKVVFLRVGDGCNREFSISAQQLTS